MKREPKNWDPDREASPHVIFGGGYYCPAPRWTYFLAVDGKCPGCGAEVRDPEESRKRPGVDPGGEVG